MEPKRARHDTLIRLVESKAIGTQQALLDALATEGAAVDQSTLSRDLRELGIRKIDGRYQRVDAMPPESVRTTPRSPVRSTVACGPNLLVIHTEIGQAQPVGVFLDGADEPAIEGTLAGDDTVFVATKGRRQQEVVLRRLATWFGEGAP